MSRILLCAGAIAMLSGAAQGAETVLPYDRHCTEREQVFEFTHKPSVRLVGLDRYEITFTLKGYCDVTVGIVDKAGTVVRHLGSGVLGKNAPAPFQKDSLAQTLYWNGKDDLGEYHKTPERLKVRVMLGLKPEFDKLLGVTHPKAMSGALWGIAADETGVYVFERSDKISWKKFDHDAKYLRDLYPPPGNLPAEKLGGMGYIEYEPGRRAIQAPNIADGMWHYGKWAPGGLDAVWRCRPAVANGRIYLLSSGDGQRGSRGETVNYLHWFGTDGSTEYGGIVGRPWIQSSGESISPHMAVSPDGKKLYVTALLGAGTWGTSPTGPVVMGGPLEGEGQAKVLVGKFNEVGSDDQSLNRPADVACDGEGRVYVVDTLNNRIQIFSAEGKFLKTIKVQQPALVQVHQKTGVIYAVHGGTVGGRSVTRITRFAAFPYLREQKHWDGIGARVMTLDSWAPKPRLWVSGRTTGEGKRVFADTSGATIMQTTTDGVLLQVYEDDGEQLRLISDFEKEVRESSGANFMAFHKEIRYPVYCDPVAERAYYNGEYVFDLRSGQLLGGTPGHISFFSGLAFCKRGYLHVHQHGRDEKFVMRVDPSRPVERLHPKGNYTEYTEVPYDYGEELMGRRGVLRSPTTDDKYYSWGLGVNMRGDLAVLHMYKVGARADLAGDASQYQTQFGGETVTTAAEYVRQLAERKVREEQTFIEYIRPRAGIDVRGAVIWTYSSHGELTDKEALIVGNFRTNGVQLDEDGFLYFTNGRLRYADGRPFLTGRGGNFGGAPYVAANRSPFTGTHIKAAPRRASFVLRTAPIPADGLPSRPPDLIQTGEMGKYSIPENDVWAEGVEWLYAGASPIVSFHCSCMDMRGCLDWYKRSFVPEMYRHSLGIVDTAGNLICHAGRYGNLDEGGKPGADGDGIAMTRGSHVSATDNYLVIADWGRRLIVAKLNYHAEETAEIGGK